MLEFLRITKVYVWEYSQDGVQTGQGRVRLWFFDSPYKAHTIAGNSVPNVQVKNFHRVY